MDRPTDPGDRRPGAADRPSLARPPGERYRAAEPSGAEESPAAARTVGLAALAALAGAGAIAVLGGALAMSAGLLVAAGAVGWAIGRVASTAGRTMSARVRAILAVGLSIASVVLGHVGVWLIATAQGGILGPIDYLAQTRGILGPAAVLVAALIAWWTVR